jgi:hypothetical protein
MINLELSTDLITDSNHPTRRFFRCWIDGSYKGEGHYHNNCDVARENYSNDKRLRSHVISEWCDYMATDNDCSVSTVQRHMVNAFTGNQLDALNAELIDDLRDLVCDEMECGA